MTRFTISRRALYMISDFLQSMNLESVLLLERERIVVHLFDTTRARALIIEYPIKLDGEPVEIGVKTDWLYNKVKLMKGKEIECVVKENVLILTQSKVVSDVKVRQNHEITLLDLENSMVRDVTFKEEPTVELTVSCELPDVDIFREAISAIDTGDFYTSATEAELTIESVMDYSSPASKITLFTPSIIKDEDNRTLHERKPIAGFVEKIIDTTTTVLSFGKDDVLTIESIGKDIRFKLYSAPLEE